MSSYHPRLKWLTPFVESLNRALDGAIHGIEVKEDELEHAKVLVTLKSKENLGRDYNNLTSMARTYARANDCVLGTCKKVNGGLSMEILTKHKGGLSMNYDPIKGERALSLSRR